MVFHQMVPCLLISTSGAVLPLGTVGKDGDTVVIYFVTTWHSSSLSANHSKFRVVLSNYAGVECRKGHLTGSSVCDVVAEQRLEV